MTETEVTMEHDAANLLEQGRVAVEAAASKGIPLRLLGGLGILARCPSAKNPPLARRYGDLDFMGLSRDSRGLIELLEYLGYRPEPRFNSLNGHRRLLFKMEAGRNVDVLLDRFEMCHTIDLRDRIEIDVETLSLADLALTKLQVVEITAKDLTDSVALFADHSVSEGRDAIDSQYIVELCSKDWGLHKTVGINIQRAIEFARQLNLPLGERAGLRLSQLAQLIESEPKHRRWKLRSLIGERSRWYELPEES